MSIITKSENDEAISLGFLPYYPSPGSTQEHGDFLPAAITVRLKL